MAIKVLEHGDRYGKVVFTCTCCGCKFECNKTDIDTETVIINSHTSARTSRIQCPECKSWLPEELGIDSEPKVTV